MKELTELINELKPTNRRGAYAKTGDNFRLLQMSYPGPGGRERKNVSYVPADGFEGDMKVAKGKTGVDASKTIRLAVAWMHATLKAGEASNFIGRVQDVGNSLGFSKTVRWAVKAYARFA